METQQRLAFRKLLVECITGSTVQKREGLQLWHASKRLCNFDPLSGSAVPEGNGSGMSVSWYDVPDSDNLTIKDYPLVVDICNHDTSIL